MADKSDYIRRIRHLLEKTVENCCTEAEAMLAAEKAADLMAEYELTLTDIELGATKCEQRNVNPGGTHGDPIEFCMTAVGYFTDTKVWRNTEEATEFGPTDLFGDQKWHRRETRNWVFFGLPHDCEIAEYITAICKGAMDRAAVDFRAEFGRKPKVAWCEDFRFGDKGHGTWKPQRECEKQLYAFRRGMAASMSTTLRRLKDERRGKASTGRDLIVVKNSMIERDMNALGITLGRGGYSRPVGGYAYASGKDAGRDVRFDPGVGTGGRLKQIGN